ncbi:uncharacterized protein [Sagmatias obliquidens]|uniref:uncharacterized protein isoform X1 n=1 Tax=Sagmatias obliquidens TaxID=3371155 RepID=UPI000F4438A7|nr:uncharacterized protein LOC113609779 isoform X1 [Lagenorhynchus obliquidens]
MPAEEEIFPPPLLVLVLLKGKEGSDELTLDWRAVKRGARERERLKFPEAISVFFSVLCNFTYDISQCVAALLETPLVRAPPLLAGLPIKGQPELQRIPAEDPETAGGSPTASAHSYHEGLRRRPRCHPRHGCPLRSCICLPIFITRKNRQVCANPEKKWVKEYINALELS